MALASAQVIDAIAARLSGAGVTPAGTRVYTSRAWPLAESGLPAWRVVAGDETVEQVNITWPHVNDHELQVDLRGVVAAADNLDDALHAMAEAALKRLFTDRSAATLSPLRVRMVLSGIERSLQEDGQAKVGVITVQLTARFQTKADAPDIII